MESSFVNFTDDGWVSAKGWDACDSEYTWIKCEFINLRILVRKEKKKERDRERERTKSDAYDNWRLGRNIFKEKV